MASCNGCDVQLSGRSNVELLPAFVDEPLACTLDGGQFEGRVAEFRALFAWLLSAERLPKGFRWTFQNGPGVERRVRELARREHLCCPFLSFVISTQGEQLIWESRGPDGADDIVDQFFALSDLSRESAQALVQLTRHPVSETH
jgi:hypothetical protein